MLCFAESICHAFLCDALSIEIIMRKIGIPERHISVNLTSRENINTIVTTIVKMLVMMSTIPSEKSDAIEFTYPTILTKILP